jgi:hypothetical protein
MTTMIFDPSKPARLFDGAAKIFSTCRDCGQLLTVIDPYSFTHPCCDAKPTEMENLTRQWITALACDEKSRATRLKKSYHHVGRPTTRLAFRRSRLRELGLADVPAGTAQQVTSHTVRASER